MRRLRSCAVAHTRLFQLNIHHHGKTAQPVPLIVQKIVFDYAARFVLMQIADFHSIHSHVQHFFVQSRDHGSRERLDERFDEGVNDSGSEWSRPHSARRTPQRDSSPSACELIEVRADGAIQSAYKFDGKPPTSLLQMAQHTKLRGVTAALPNGDARHNIAASGTAATARRRLPLVSGVVELATLAPTSLATSTAAVLSPRRTTSAERSEDAFESEFLRVLARVNAALERNEMRLAEKDRRNAVRLEWEAVASVLDRLFVVLLAFVSTLTSLAMIYQRELIELIDLL